VYSSPQESKLLDTSIILKPKLSHGGVGKEGGTHGVGGETLGVLLWPHSVRVKGPPMDFKDRAKGENKVAIPGIILKGARVTKPATTASSQVTLPENAPTPHNSKGEEKGRRLGERERV